MKSQKPSEDNQQVKSANSNSPRWLQTIQTIYQLKLWRILLVLILATIAFFALDSLTKQIPENVTWLQWLRLVPWQTLGGSSFSIVVIAFVYEWLVRRETEQKLAEILREAIDSRDELMNTQISKALLIDQAIMHRLLSKEIIDHVIRTSLQIRLGDDELAKDAYDSLLSQVLTYEERWNNYRHKFTVATIQDENATEGVRQKYYETFIDLRYDVRLQKTSFLFTCVPTIEEYNILVKDKSWELRWIFPPSPDFPQVNQSAFDVEFVNVGGLDLNLRKETLDGRYVIAAEHPGLQSMLGKSVTVYYRYRVKVQKRGHLLMTNVVFPTKNLVVEFDYANTDIYYVNVLDFFVSNTKPVIRYTPSRQSPRKIEVELNEWVLPKSGVVFAWILSGEMTPAFLKLSSEERRKQAKSLPKTGLKDSTPH